MRDHHRCETPFVRDEACGVLLLLGSTMAFSTAGFFTRMAPVAPFAMIVWRNIFGALGLALVITARGGNPVAQLARLNRTAWLAAACSAAGMICYLAAFALTSVANISIIYAAAPMITAVLARFVLGERLTPRTAAAACVAVFGVFLTMAGSVAAASWTGDGLALLMTIGLSVVAVLTRGGRPPPLPTALASAVLAALATLPFAVAGGLSLAIDLRNGIWLAIFGLVTISFAWPASLAGAARIPAARAMLISASELPLGPLWVWLAFGEAPSHAAWIGGAFVAGAVLFDVSVAGGARLCKANGA